MKDQELLKKLKPLLKKMQENSRVMRVFVDDLKRATDSLCDSMEELYNTIKDLPE